MTLTKPSQDLRRNLQGLASDLKWSAVEVVRVALSVSAIITNFCTSIDFLGCHHHLSLSDYSLNENGCFKERP